MTELRMNAYLTLNDRREALVAVLIAQDCAAQDLAVEQVVTKLRALVSYHGEVPLSKLSTLAWQQLPTRLIKEARVSSNKAFFLQHNFHLAKTKKEIIVSLFAESKPNPQRSAMNGKWCSGTWHHLCKCWLHVLSYGGWAQQFDCCEK